MGATEMGVHARFGRAVALRRTRAKLTQDQLAAMIGLSRTSIANIEQGRQQVLLHHAVAIADALNVSLEELIGRSEQPAEGPKGQLPDNLDKELTDWAKIAFGTKR